MDISAFPQITLFNMSVLMPIGTTAHRNLPNADLGLGGKIIEQ